MKQLWMNVARDLVRGDLRNAFQNARFLVGMWVGGFTQAGR